MNGFIGQGPADDAKLGAESSSCPGLRKLSRTASYSADGAMMFRPSSESSLNSGSDPGPEDTQHFGNEQATVDVDWSPIRDQNPSHLPEPRSSPSRALRQNQHQSPNCPDSNGSHSQLVQDDHLLPINSAPTSPLAPNEPKIRSGSSSHSLPIELEGATHQREASPRATSSKCDTTELQSVSSKNENLPKDQEEQTEDDNDLFEGDKDLRLHRLGVGKSRSHDSNRKEDESCPAVEPTDEVEDRFSSIEKQLETYMARTEEPQLTEGEEKIQRAIAEPPHVSSKLLSGVLGCTLTWLCVLSLPVFPIVL